MLRPEYPDFIHTDILIARAQQGEKDAFDRLQEYSETLPEPRGRDEQFIQGKIEACLQSTAPLFAQTTLQL